MISSPGDSDQALAMVKNYLAFTDTARSLVPALSVNHADVTARHAEIDARLVRELDRLPAAPTKCRAGDPFLLFDREPLGLHLLRLLMAVEANVAHARRAQHAAAVQIAVP